MTPSMVPASTELATSNDYSDIIRRMTWYEIDHSPTEKGKQLEITNGTEHWSQEMAGLLDRNLVEITKPNPDDPNDLNKVLIPEGQHEAHSLLSLPSDWSETFSMTHVRLLACAGVSAEQRRQALNELYRITRPRGAIQLIELDLCVKLPDTDQGPGLTATRKLVEWMKACTEADGLAWDSFEQLYTEVEQAGFKHDPSSARHIARMGPLVTFAGEGTAVFKFFGGMKDRVVKRGLASESEFENVLGDAVNEWKAAEKAGVEIGFNPYILTAGKMFGE